MTCNCTVHCDYFRENYMRAHTFSYISLYIYTRKYPLRGYILGVLTHTTAWDRLWGGDLFLRSYIRYRRGLTGLLELWPCGFKICYTHLGFASAAAFPLGTDGDPGCIFFSLKTCQATFISDILWNNCRKSKKMKVWRTDGRKDRQTWSLK